MKWQSKAALQQIFSHLPRGAELNYLCSRYVTKTLPQSPEITRLDYSFAAEYLKWFRTLGTVPIEDARFYEFGAGWNLTIPLSLYSLGVNHQFVTDLRRLLRAELASHSSNALTVMKLTPSPSRRPPVLSASLPSDELDETLHTLCGIRYGAPFDARATGMPADSIDYITATKVLGFIPSNVLIAIFNECARVLRPGGLIGVLVDYRDNYAYIDPEIGVYNFLRYSDRIWKTVYSPPLFYQNRLRHSDYQDLFAAAGFEILVEQPGYDGSIQEAREQLAQIRLANLFKRYEIDDLAAVRAVFILRKPRDTRTLNFSHDLTN